ncbi:MAG: DUF4368 domain-containing protein [Clostridiales bacterium]|nr:DUF4368 domain-containing protein [Clostridiales bacterium]
MKNVRKYTDHEELIVAILNDLVNKIVVHALDKSSGRRKLKFTTRRLALSILPMRTALFLTVDLVCRTQKRKQPDNKKRRHSRKTVPPFYKNT